MNIPDGITPIVRRQETAFDNSALKRVLALMQLVKPALHRLCGKGWTNNINTRHNRPSRIKPVSDNRNVGFHIAGIAVFANKNIHKNIRRSYK